MTKSSRSSAKGKARAPRHARGEPEPVTSFAQAWTVLSSSSASREQRARFVRMLSAALIVFATAGVTAAGRLI